MAQYEYITKSGEKKIIEAESPAAAISSAIDRDPSSGVALVKSPTPPSPAPLGGPTPVAPATSAGSAGKGDFSIPGTAITSGISASFVPDMQSVLKDAEKVGKELEGLFPKPPKTQEEEKQTPEFKALEASKEFIRTGYEAAREEIEDIRAKGELERSRARELLGMAPAAIKYHIDTFLVESENFDRGIARSIERLTKEENAAIANADYQYAQQLRQQKVDYANLQRTILQDRYNFLSNAYNLMLTGKTIERQEKLDEQTRASNRLNTILAAESGKRFDELSPETRAAVIKDAETLGIPVDVARSIVETPDIKYQVSKGNSVLFFDGKGNLVRTYTVSRGTGNSADAYLRGYFTGEIGGVTNVPEEYKQDFLNALDIIKRDAIGNLVWNERTAIAGSVGAIGQDAAEVKEDIVNRVTERITKNPQAVAQILNLNYSPSFIDESHKQGVKEIVIRYVEELIPDEFVYRLQVRKNLPILFSNGQ